MRSKPFLVALLAAWLAVHSANGAARLPASTRVGGLELVRCAAVAAYCGQLVRAFDPAGGIPGTVSIHFEWYPHTRIGPVEGTFVATEGGPGYPATGSRADYLALFAPLMAHRDLLIMDNRGTGQSGAIDCRALQTADKWTETLVADCGLSLGERAPFYGTAYATDDLAAILQNLGVRRIDLYGDSYGTYFEQTFALRHSEMLRSIVLDGAYPLSGPDYAWYPSYAPAMRSKLNGLCARSPGCALIPGTSIDHIQPTLEALRNAPTDAVGQDLDGHERRFRADPAQLAIVLFGGAPALTTAREIDAAARAFTQGDQPPLLRLMAETAAAVDSRDSSADATRWSAGLAAAVMCGDPPQIFDMTLPPAERAADRERVLAVRRRVAPDTYAPFTIDEFRKMPLDYSFLDQCVGWPSRGESLGAGAVNRVYPDIPALVVSGEFDDMTTTADGEQVAASFRRGVHLLVANSFHVNALPRSRSDCAAHIVRRFFRTLKVEGAACAARVPPLILVTQFARRVAELVPAQPLPGNAAAPQGLRIVAAAVLTAGDVLARIDSESSGSLGLRGGSFRVTQTASVVRADLNQVRWVSDVAVSGSLQRSRGRNGQVSAVLNVSYFPGETPAQTGSLKFSWRDGLGDWVSVRGRMAGVPLAARAPTP